MKAWAPGHATLFFAVPKKFDIPLQMGSIGGGFNFSEGVETSVSDANEDVIYWNSKKISGEVSTTTLNLFRTISGVTKSRASKMTGQRSLRVPEISTVVPRQSSRCLTSHNISKASGPIPPDSSLPDTAMPRRSKNW